MSTAVDATVIIQLNQSVPENGGNHFPAAFWVCFFRKKVTIKLVLTLHQWFYYSFDAKR